jgi:hypothetical protein
MYERGRQSSCVFLSRRLDVGMCDIKGRGGKIYPVFSFLLMRDLRGLV